MFDVEGLHKSYGSKEVLCGVDLSVPPGQVLALLGANGAGKTTLVSIAAGLLTPDAGTVRVAGFDMSRQRREAATHIGFAPQDTGVYPTLNVSQNLEFFARLAGVARKQVGNRVLEVAAAFALDSLLDQQVDKLSGGQRRRLHTAIAVVHHPDVLFLDEPTVGADVAARAGLLDVVRALAASGTAVLYTTHYLAEVEQLDAEVAILHEGRIAVAGSVHEVTASFARTRATLSFAGDAPDLPGWQASGHCLVRDISDDEIGSLVADALASLRALGTGAHLTGMEIVRPSLEHAYLAVTGDRLSSHEETLHAFAA